MVTVRTCRERNQNGGPCGSPPLLDGDRCYMHCPQHAEEMQEARRHGGLRRRRENTLEVVYDIEGIDTVEQLRRLLKIAVLEALALENTPARVRALLSAVTVGARLLEIHELAEELAAIRGVLDERLPKARRRR